MGFKAHSAQVLSATASLQAGKSPRGREMMHAGYCAKRINSKHFSRKYYSTRRANEEKGNGDM